MNTLKKMKLTFLFSLIATVCATALKTAAMFLEFDKTIGFFYESAPLNTASNLILMISVIAFAAMSFTFKKRELFPIINYSSSVFRFFSSTSGCLMFVYAYVKWNEYLTEKKILSDANVKKANFLLILTLLALAAGIALFVYAFGRNEKNSPKRAFVAFIPAGVVLVRAIEIQFDGNIEMNDPLKVLFQLSSVVLMLSVVYTAKCEFKIHETNPRMRYITLALCPVFTLTFAVSTIICYYSQVSTVFAYLVDALLYLSLCGFVVSSYYPCAKAKPICDAKWGEYIDEIEALNGSPYGGDYSYDSSADNFMHSDAIQTSPVDTSESDSSLNTDDVEDTSSKPENKEGE